MPQKNGVQQPMRWFFTKVLWQFLTKGIYTLKTTKGIGNGIPQPRIGQRWAPPTNQHKVYFHPPQKKPSVLNKTGCFNFGAWDRRKFHTNQSAKVVCPPPKKPSVLTNGCFEIWGPYGPYINMAVFKKMGGFHWGDISPKL